MRAHGTAGALRVGYQQAAVLGAWEIALAPRLPRAFLFKAAVVEAHPYWITQAPLDLVLELGSVEWLWRGVAAAPRAGVVEFELAERPIVSERVHSLARSR